MRLSRYGNRVRLSYWSAVCYFVAFLSGASGEEDAKPTSQNTIFELPIKNPKPLINDNADLDYTQLCSRCSLQFGGSPLPSKADAASQYTDGQFYLDLTPSLGCNISDYDSLKSLALSVSGKKYQAFVIVKRGECNFSQRAAHAATINAAPSTYQNTHITGVIVTTGDSVFPPGPSNTTTDANSKVLLCTIKTEFYTSLVPAATQKWDSFKYYNFTKEDANIPKISQFTQYIETVIIWLIAMVSMICAAKYMQLIINYKRTRETRKNDREANGTGEDDGQELIESEADDTITSKKVAGMVVCASIFLVTLYFLYKYLVWVMMVMFVLMSAMTMMLLAANMSVMLCPKLVGPQPSLNCWVLGKCTVFDLVTLSIGLGIGIVWFIFRHSTWAWILQDIMGFAFCVTVPSQLKVDNLKVVTILLAAFFFYDIFMVFGTKLITKDGESVMVEVATGAGTGEVLPMLFKVPRFSQPTVVKSCADSGYSMLGFGDIIVPAIMTNLCVKFDFISPIGRRRCCKSYTTWAIISYGFSLMVCFLALSLMGVGQPALLYINPIMVVTVSVLACLRGEFKVFWNKGVKLNDFSYRTSRRKWQICADTAESRSLTSSRRESEEESRHTSQD